MKRINQNQQSLPNLLVEVSAPAHPGSLKPGLQHSAFRWLWLGLILWCSGPSAPAQLAITEVMSHGSTDLSGNRHPDFWELTNFGTNVVNLKGYRWFDADEKSFEDRRPLPDADIAPGESILFVRDNTAVPDALAFGEWWWPDLPDNLQIHFWGERPGFDDIIGDAVRLWDANSNLVDEARFETARPGVTFTYDTNTAAFSEFSREGVAGAFRAVMGGDIGSPGFVTNKGPVSLSITKQPTSLGTNLAVDPGSEVILKVQATGRPGPQYQWYFNDEPIETAGASSFAIPRLVCFADCGPSWRRAPNLSDLVLPAIQPTNSGDYFVEVFNGLEKLTSAVVKITVNTNPSPIQVECPPGEPCVPCSGTNSPANLVVSLGQTAIFTVQNRGFPVPTFQWSRSLDGVTFTDLPGATNRDVELSSIQASDAGLYRVRMQNTLGATNAFARLTVKPSPSLEITEVMSQACPDLDQDWWELTNTGAEPVNLCGYRWDDATTRNETGGVVALSIGGGPTITKDVTLLPGESAILMESQTAESFVQWWGASNLPPNLRFITYNANGLGGEIGDYIYVWDANETQGSRFVANVVFSGAIAGFTRWFDSFIAMHQGCGDPTYGAKSNQGDCGAFKADQGCEIGSPGWTRLTPPMLTSVRRAGGSTVLEWRAQPGSQNKVQFTHQLAAPVSATIWQDLGTTFQFPSAACVATDANTGTESQRFYRVVKVAAANCPCPEE